MSKFINPTAIIAQAGISIGQTVADLGCGSGFYTLSALQAVGSTGKVYAVDVQKSKLEATASLARQMNNFQLELVLSDLVKPITGVPQNKCDVVIVGNVMHEIADKQTLLKNVYALLKTGGSLVVVEWNKTEGPLGPESKIRISEEELSALAQSLGFKFEKQIEADIYHYSLIFTK